MPTPPEPWDRQPDESEEAYAAFAAYRDLGAGRSVVEAYRQSEGKAGAKQASGRWNRWAKDHRWSERALAWDRRLDRVKQAAAENAEAESVEELTRLRREWNRSIRLRAAALAGRATRLLAADAGKPVPTARLRAAGAVLDQADQLVRRAIDDGMRQHAAPQRPGWPGWTGPPRIVEVVLPDEERRLMGGADPTCEETNGDVPR